MSTGKPTQPATLSTPLLALLREHTGKLWEVDPDDPTMAILRVPILDLVREHLSESEPVKPTQPVKKAPVKKTPAKKVAPLGELSDDQKREATLALAKKLTKITGATVVHLWEPEGLTKKTRGNKAREFLLSLSMQRVLERHGKGPGSYYTLRGE